MPFLGQTSTQPQQLGAFGLTQAALARLAGRGPGPEVVHLPAQRLLLEAELPGHSGDRATGVDHQLHGFVFVLRSKPDVCVAKTFRYWAQQLGIGYGVIALAGYFALIVLTVLSVDSWV
jgi:hypothetical protein